MLNINLTVMKKSLIALIVALTCFIFNINTFAGVDENAEAVDQLQEPDLVIEGMSVEPAHPQSGDTINAVLVTVLNRGVTTAPADTSIGVSLTGGFDADDIGVRTGQISRELAPEQSAVVRIEAGYQATGGETRIYGKADVFEQVREINERNNSSVITVNVPRPPDNVPDLIVRSVRLLPEGRVATSCQGNVSCYRAGRREELVFEVGILNLNVINRSYNGIQVRVGEGQRWSSTGTADIIYEARPNVFGANNQTATATVRLNTRDISTGLHGLQISVDDGNRVRESNENNNNWSWDLNIMRLDDQDEVVDRLEYPDLAIEEMRTEPARPQSGDYINAVLVTVLNRGIRPAPADTRVGISLTGGYGVGDIGVSTGQVSGELAPGRREVVRVAAGYLMSAGEMRIYGKADVFERVTEVNENNNSSLITVNAPRPPDNVPDLIVNSVRLLPEGRVSTSCQGNVSCYRVGREEDLTFEADIMNLNVINRSYNNIQVRISDGHGWSATGTANITYEERPNVLGANNQTATATVRLNTRDISTGLHTLQISVDTNNRVRESNENNNTYHWNVNVFKVFRESDEPLPVAPVIFPMISGDTVVRGTYNRNYRNAAVDVLLDGHVFFPAVPVSNGEINIPRQGNASGRSSEGYYYSGQRLRIRLHATQGVGDDAVMQTADSLETVVRYWKPRAPRIIEPVPAGRQEVRGTYDTGIVNPRVSLESAGPRANGEFHFAGTADLDNGTFVVRLERPLEAGVRLRAGVSGHRDEESAARGGGGSISDYSYVVTVGGQPGQTNLTVSDIQVLSDREERALENITAGSNYRVRFTLHNSGENYVRAVSARVTGSGRPLSVDIDHETGPGENYVYTSGAVFTGEARGSNEISVVIDPRNALRESNENDNTAEREAGVSAAQEGEIDENNEYADMLEYPDLVIEEMRTEPARPQSGDYINAVLVTVLNRGVRPAPADSRVGISLTGGYGAGDIGVSTGQVSGELAPGRREVVRVEAGYQVTGGETRIYGKADAFERVMEINENNNSSLITVNVPRPPDNVPDLIVNFVRLLPEGRISTLCQGNVSCYHVGREEDLTFEADIMNLNVINRSYNNIQVRISDGHGWSATGTANITYEEHPNVLGANNQTATATVRLNTHDISTGLHTLQISVDANNRVRESNENNNTYHWNVNVFKVYRESDEPLPDAPVIFPVTTGDTVVRGAFNRNYRNTTADLLLDGQVFIPAVPVSNGVINIPRQGEHYSIEGYYYSGQRLRIRLHATQGGGDDAVMQTGDSLETVVRYWKPRAPRIIEPVAAGRQEVRGTYDAGIVNPRVSLESAGPRANGEFHFAGTAELDNGTFVVRLERPLEAGVRLRAEVSGHRDEESAARGGGGSISDYSYVVTVGGQPGQTNLTVSDIQVLSDREERALENITAGSNYRVRFTLHNRGENYVRSVSARVTGSGRPLTADIDHEIAPGGSYVYTSGAVFTGEARGSNEISVVIDPRNALRESNENDNEAAWNDRDWDLVEISGSIQHAAEYSLPQNMEQQQNAAERPAAAQPDLKLRRSNARITLMQVRSLSPANNSTNPFDFREVASDVSAARQRKVNNTPSPQPSAQYPIALTTTFTSLLMVSPGNTAYLPVESGGSGTNTLGDFTLSSGAGTALLIENSFDTYLHNWVRFTAKEGWTIISQSVSNPVPFTDVNLVIKRNSDNNYFKITTKIYASASAMDIFTLSGYNCGPSQADCP